jgi:hypothetical protein
MSEITATIKSYLLDRHGGTSRERRAYSARDSLAKEAFSPWSTQGSGVPSVFFFFSLLNATVSAL